MVPTAYYLKDRVSTLLGDSPTSKLFGAVVAGGGLSLATYALYCALSAEKKTLSHVIRWNDNYYGGKVFAEVFKAHGVKFVFTLTGGHIAPILVGCKDVGIRVIDVRHEVNAVFAADAVSRLTGIPGVAVVTAGPGLTNTVTAVKNAQMAQSPLVLIGGATSDLLKGKGSLQDIDQMALMKPHVKWYTHVNYIKDIAPAVEEAFKRAQEGTPGPVFVEVPLDILYKERDIRKFYEKDLRPGGNIIERAIKFYIARHLGKIFQNNSEISIHKPLTVSYPKPSSWKVQKVAKVLSTAKKPVMIIGSQTMLLNDQITNGNLTKAVTKLGIPSFLSGMARGLLGQDSRVQCRQKETRRKALREADVVILAGVPCDFRLNYGNSINRRAVFVSANRDAVDLKKNRSPDVAVHGDPCEFLIQLSESITSSTPSNFASWLQELKDKDREEEAKIAKDSSQPVEKFINPLYVCQKIEELADPKAIFVADGGDFVASASYILRPRSPLSWMDPGPFGTLGVGCGFALGAKLCNPDSEVYVIFGDGALGFSMSEYDTMVRHNIPVIAVVGNDAAWTQILRDQKQFFDNDGVGCMLDYTNYQDCVKGFGAEGIVVKDTAEVIDALKKAKELAKNKPVLVNVMIGTTSFREGSISM